MYSSIYCVVTVTRLSSGGKYQDGLKAVAEKGRLTRGPGASLGNQTLMMIEVTAR